jgi:L-iditol 2-dehydrogenase
MEGGMLRKPVRSPHVPGHEFSAIIEKVGPDVEGFEPGERVAVEPAVSCGHCEHCLQGQHHLCPDIAMSGSFPVDGAFQDELLYRASDELLIRLPDSISDEDGAMLEPLGVAMHALELYRLRIADTVAILGAGTIGLLITRLARLAGASEIIVTDPLAYRLEVARSLGASQVINPKETDVVEEIMELTGGRGVDVVFDACAAPEAYFQGVEIARPGGTFVIVGIPVADTVEFPYPPLMKRELRLIFQKRMNDTYPRALKLIQQGVIDFSPIVTHRFTLEETVQAHEMAHSYEDGVIKAVVYVNDPRQLL